VALRSFINFWSRNDIPVMNTEFLTDQCRSLWEFPYPVWRTQYKSPNNDGPVNCSNTYPLKVPSTSLRCRTTAVYRRKCFSFVAITAVTHLFAVQRETHVSVEDISNLAPVSSSLPQRWLTTQNGTRCSKLLWLSCVQLVHTETLVGMIDSSTVTAFSKRVVGKCA
jgi:hypothetical protein